MSVAQVYWHYVGPGKDMTCRTFVALCKNSGLEGDNFKDFHAERIFTQCMPLARRRLDLQRFEAALGCIAEAKGMDEAELKQLVIDANNNRRDSALEHLRRPSKGLEAAVVSRLRPSAEGQSVLEVGQDLDGGGRDGREGGATPSSKRSRSKRRGPKSEADAALGGLMLPPSCPALSMQSPPSPGSLGSFGSSTALDSSGSNQLNSTDGGEEMSAFGSTSPLAVQLPSFSPSSTVQQHGALQDVAQTTTYRGGHLANLPRVHSSPDLAPPLQARAADPRALTDLQGDPLADRPGDGRGCAPAGSAEALPAARPAVTALREPSTGVVGFPSQTHLPFTNVSSWRVASGADRDETSRALARWTRPGAPQVRSAQLQLPCRLGDDGDAAAPAGGPPARPAGEEGELSAVEAVFRSFCGAQGSLDAKGFSRLCKRCCLFDDRFSSRDALLAFSSVVPPRRARMDWQSFAQAVEQVAATKGVDVLVVRRLIEQTPPDHAPQLGGGAPRPPVVPEAVPGAPEPAAAGMESMPGRSVRRSASLPCVNSSWPPRGGEEVPKAAVAKSASACSWLAAAPALAPPPAQAGQEDGPMTINRVAAAVVSRLTSVASHAAMADAALGPEVDDLQRPTAALPGGRGGDRMLNSGASSESRRSPSLPPGTADSVLQTETSAEPVLPPSRPTFVGAF